MEDILKTVRGVVIMRNDSFKSSLRNPGEERVTVRYGEHTFEELYVEEIVPGDNVIFAAMSDDPKEPNRIISAHIATDLQPKSANIKSNCDANDLTISFTAIQTPSVEAVEHATRLLKRTDFGKIENLYPDTVPALYDQNRPLADALKDMGPLHLDPIARNVLGETSFEYVVPIRGKTILKAGPTVDINGRTHLVIQNGDPVPPHRHSYLFINHDHNNNPTNGFILSGVFLSEYINNLRDLPSFPALSTKWVDRLEAENVKFDFAGPVEDWYIIATHGGEIVYNDPKAIVEGIGDKGTVLQPNTPLPTKPVNVLLLDYDVIPGFATRMYEASNVDLGKIVKDGRIDVKRPLNGLPGFLIEGIIFSETMPYTFQFYGNSTNYPRFRE